MKRIISILLFLQLFFVATIFSQTQPYYSMLSGEEKNKISYLLPVKNQFISPPSFTKQYINIKENPIKTNKTYEYGNISNSSVANYKNNYFSEDFFNGITDFISSQYGGEIPFEFYENWVSIYLVYQPTRASLGLQGIDFCGTSGELWDLYMDAKMLIVSDILNIKSAPYYKNEKNFTTNLLEWRMGLNVIANSSYNVALGIQLLDIWNITDENGANARSYVTSGWFLKTDIKLSREFIMRYLFAPDIFNLGGNSPTSKDEKVSIYNNSLEFIHESGLFAGITYIPVKYGPLSSLNNKYARSSRFEIKFGIKVF